MIKITLSKPIQYIIMSIITLTIIFYFVLLIGDLEYKKTFCNNQEELRENKIAIFYEDQQIKTYPETKEGHYGCCFIDNKQTEIKKNNCLLYNKYKKPKLSDKISSFLKRFK